MTMRPPSVVLNDRHSALNASVPLALEHPAGLPAIREAVARAARAGVPLAIAGARHAMGGQQFCHGGVVLDLERHAAVRDFDAARGLVTVDAGIRWPALQAWLAQRRDAEGRGWSIRQKQSGADDFSIGGSLAANAHGRGLDFAPLVADIERFRLVLASGDAIDVDRASAPELFAAAIGGYGLLGVVDTATLRLVPRCKLERRVRLVDVADVAVAFDAEIAQGSLYGDFQFAVDPRDGDFLRRGVFACYRPLPDDAAMPPVAHALDEERWRALMRLAHVDKREAFARYAAFYLASDGQRYASDDHQFGLYPDGYHAALDDELGHRGSEMIGEMYVPAAQLATFMHRAADDLRVHGADVVYGTVRRIRADRETLLPWARDDFLCVVFNLHVRHDAAGIAAARDDFRRLIDNALSLGGSYYLTYHGYARADQVRHAYPRIDEFFALKNRVDPQGVFASDWYRRLRATLAGAP
ncbi:FAD-binding protein [Tahibacter soli]|uniref:FAD-binding oxidoreductase n=1 Tax=Tahibacter soli TaxID=2983605 RepID=A0A9X3YQE1_9GAMM|nr:FAD-binding oxidoreductase [Tahibacter soli]MDC8015580.1 FAD-binding oxidoreductase [Tahibacter soli]